MDETEPCYGPFTVKMMWQLAAPHTWPASIIPVLIALAAASCHAIAISATMAIILLVISVLFQAAVNTFNDYFDYIKGVDSADDNVEASDAVLVYNSINPKAVLAYAIGLLLIAFILGVYVIIYAGWIPLVIAGIGALIVVLYSGGKTPISYLPIGELVSGVVMGALITLACYQALTGFLNWWALVWSIPQVIGIGLIMMTNNTCDIEKDIDAGRHTWPSLMGRARSRAVYHGLIITWICSILVIIAIWFTHGLIVAPFLILTAYPLARALWLNPLAPPSRVGAMGQIASLNVALGGFYAAAIFASTILVFP